MAGPAVTDVPMITVTAAGVSNIPAEVMNGRVVRPGFGVWGRGTGGIAPPGLAPELGAWPCGEAFPGTHAYGENRCGP